MENFIISRGMLIEILKALKSQHLVLAIRLLREAAPGDNDLAIGVVADPVNRAAPTTA